MKAKTLLPYAGLLLLALIVGMLAAYLTLGHRRPPPPRTDALLLHEAKPLPDFTLRDTTGAAFTDADLKSHWSLLYFGYTHCPDACPTTLAALTRMTKFLGRLPADKQPHVYFISVDPKRDTPVLLRNYTAYFNPHFTGVTGALPELKALTAPLGADFSYDPADQKGNYSVVHSAMVVLVDPEAEETALFTPPLDPERMASDYVNIIRYYGEQW